jgi:hypothetical protein
VAEGDRDQGGQWLNLTEAAHRLGWSRERLRSQARRGRVRTMRGNAGELLILVNDDLTGTVTADLTRPGRGAKGGQTGTVKAAPTGQEEELARLRAALAKVEAERDQLRGDLLEARERIGRAEERVAGKDALLEELRRQNDWLRLPWWRRWL